MPQPRWRRPQDVPRSGDIRRVSTGNPAAKDDSWPPRKAQSQPRTRGELFAVVHVAFDPFERHAGQPAGIAAGPEQGLDAMTVGDQFVDEIGADEARSAGDEAVHDPAGEV